MLSMMENVAKVLFHGVAARTLREKYEEITSPVYIGECVHMIVEVLWPGGKVRVQDSLAHVLLFGVPCLLCIRS